MEVVSIEQKRKIGFIPVNNNVFSGKEYADLDDFFKGTISGDELVKYVCEKLDEKYSQNQSSNI